MLISLFKKAATDLQGSLSLLTVFPVGRMTRFSNNSLWTFPLVGVIVGVCAWTVAYILGRAQFSPLIVAAGCVGALTIVTNALHEDGLADSADAYFAIADREKRRLILKDPRIGIYGMLALGWIGFFRVVLIYDLINCLDNSLFLLALVFATSTSRAAMLIPAFTGKTFAKDGMASQLSNLPWSKAFAPALVLLAIYLCIAAIVKAHSGVGLAVGISVMILIALLVGTLCTFLGFAVEKRFGGHNGDTFGCGQQLSETVVLAIISFLVADSSG